MDIHALVSFTCRSYTSCLNIFWSPDDGVGIIKKLICTYTGTCFGDIAYRPYLIYQVPSSRPMTVPKRMQSGGIGES